MEYFRNIPMLCGEYSEKIQLFSAYSEFIFFLSGISLNDFSKSQTNLDKILEKIQRRDKLVYLSTYHLKFEFLEKPEGPYGLINSDKVCVGYRYLDRSIPSGNISNHIPKRRFLDLVQASASNRQVAYV